MTVCVPGLKKGEAILRHEGMGSRKTPGEDMSRISKFPNWSARQSHARQGNLIPSKPIFQENTPSDNVMELMNIRPWIFFYLICFVALLLATTFIVQGITPLFWMSSTLIIVVVGFNFILIFNEIREHRKRKALMQQISNPNKGNVETKGKNGGK